MIQHMLCCFTCCFGQHPPSHNSKIINIYITQTWVYLAQHLPLWCLSLMSPSNVAVLWCNVSPHNVAILQYNISLMMLLFYDVMFPPAMSASTISQQCCHFTSQHLPPWDLPSIFPPMALLSCRIMSLPVTSFPCCPHNISWCHICFHH